MGIRSILVTLLPLLTLVIHEGAAIRCYVCTSAKDPSCKDPYTPSSYDHKLTECTVDSMRNIHETIPSIYSHFQYSGVHAEDFVCVKAVTREYDRETVVRSCTIPRPDTFDVCAQLKSRDLVSCQTCTRDSCNGAPTLTTSYSLLALLPVLLTLTKSIL